MPHVADCLHPLKSCIPNAGSSPWDRAVVVVFRTMEVTRDLVWSRESTTVLTLVSKAPRSNRLRQNRCSLAFLTPPFLCSH